MGFFSKLKKVAPTIQKGAVLADLAGVPGAGAALKVVEMIQAQGRLNSVATNPALEQRLSAHEDATRATAVAVDDLHERVAALEAERAQKRS